MGGGAEESFNKECHKKTVSEIDIDDNFNITLTEFPEPTYMATEKTHSDQI
jgi:hypothetical protein